MLYMQKLNRSVHIVKMFYLLSLVKGIICSITIFANCFGTGITENKLIDFLEELLIDSKDTSTILVY